MGAGDRVLDVATGRGACLRPAFERLGPSGWLLGLDIAAGMVARTSAEVRGDRRVMLARADAQQLPARHAAFDVVLAGHVISFLPDPQGALRGWARALRPGGRLGLTTFTGDDVRWKPVAEVFAAYAEAPDPRPSRAAGARPWDIDDGLTALLDNAGLVDVTHTTRPWLARFPDVSTWLAWTWSHGQRAA